MAKIKNPFPAMFDRVLPGRDKEFREAVLWSCTAYPFAGNGKEGIELYEKQIKEALAARPDDPIGWSHEQLEKSMAGAPNSVEPNAEASAASA